MKVVLEEVEPNGLASMLAGLVEANLDRHPARAALLRDGVLVLTAVDAGVSATVVTTRDSIRVRGGAADRAQVEVRASSTDLLLLASAPLRAGLPDPFSASGRAVLRDVIRRRIVLSGAVRHPRLLSMLARLLSVV